MLYNSLMLSLASLTLVHAQSSLSSSLPSSSVSSKSGELSSSSQSVRVSSSRTSTRSSSSTSFSTLTADVLPTLYASSQQDLVYYINATVGTPQQYNGLRVDIAQPYLWLLNGDEFPYCSVENITGCVSYGNYIFEDSSSSTIIDNSWESLTFLNYVIVNGSIASDNITFEELDCPQTPNSYLNISDVNFFNANDSSVLVGAVGLAGVDPNDPNLDYNMFFLDIIKESGIINSSSYSWFPKNNDSLEVVLGGVNRSHYSEPLVIFDKIPYSSEYSGLQYGYPIVPLTGMTVNNNAADSYVEISADDGTFPVLLDSRSTYTRLPYTTIINLAIQLSAVYSEAQGIWYVKCSMAGLDATIGFNFGNLTIEAPIADFIHAFSSSDSGTSSSVVFENGDPACYLLVEPNIYYGYSVLGSSFLKSAYFAVDNEGEQIAMAQALNDPRKSYALSKYSSLSEPLTSVITSVSANSTIISTSTFTATTISEELPLESSFILSGYIPFATKNNITESLTFSYEEPQTSKVIPVEISGVYSSGTIYTGRVTNSSTTHNTSSSAFGNRNAEFGSWNRYGLIGLVTMILFGFAL